MEPLDLGPPVSRLTGVQVTIEGGPCAPSWGDSGTSAWRGVAHATERLVAIAFLTTKRGTRWLKSRRSWGNAVFAEIGRSGDREAGHLMLTLGSWVWPEVRAETFEEFSARSSDGGPAEQEFQVPILTWGGAARSSVPVWGCDGPATSIPPRIEGESGLPVRVLSVPDARIAVDLLFLPRREIAARRLQIWSLKPRCRDEVPEPLRHVLCFGRAGQWPPQRRKGQRYGP